MVWAVVISITVLIVAILIQQWLFVVVEDERQFLYVIGGFMVVFVVGAVACAYLIPGLPGRADVGLLVQNWIQPGTVVQASGSDDLPLVE
jgi:hypothetical protein